MYNRYQLVKKFLSYYIHSSNSRGYGTHSPFVYNFIREILDKKEEPERFDFIEKYRKRLLRDDRVIEVKDPGAGSYATKHPERKLCDIAEAALKNKKYASLLYRISRYYRCKNIIELGTSLGTTTAYLSLSSPGGRVTTLEGADRISDIAEDFFYTAGLKNIHLIRGDFKDTLPPFLRQTDAVDLLFVDGNHQEEPTFEYFRLFEFAAHNDTIFIFDDIHWSLGMERAWEKIKSQPGVTLTIDLFFLGLVFFKKEFMVPQHFSIRF